MRNRVDARQQPQPPEYWRDIPGYNPYQASSEGRIRRVLPGGGYSEVKIVEGCGSTGKMHMANLFLGGRKTQQSVLRLVALAFYPAERVAGAFAVHRNGLHSDNSARNVMLLTPSENGKRQGGSRRRTVCMADRSGAVIEFFPSIRAASAATGLDRKTIYRHCDRRRHRELPGGISFRWDEGGD